MATFGLGREEKLYVVPEASYGSAASAPAASNAVKFKEFSLSQTEERVYREDKRGTRSYQETIPRRKSVEWSLTGYLLPSGAAGTAPDGWDDVFESAFGTETINASTSVVYTLAKEFSKPLTLHRAVGHSLSTAVFSEMARGAVVNQITFNLSGVEEAMVQVSGFAADVLRAGKGTINTDSGTVVNFTGTGEAHNFDAGMYVDIDSINDSLISAVNTTANTITVGSHSAQSNGEFVVPSACIKGQTFTSTAVPVSGILGSCTLESASTEILAATITIDNGAKPHNDVYGTDKNTSFHLGNRTVTGSITVRLDDANFQKIAKSRRSSKIALSLVSGTTAGSIATFTLGNVVVEYTPIQMVAVDDVTVTLPFKAYATSSGEDEISLTLT